MSVGLKHTNFDSESQMNSMQMMHNRQDNPILFFIKTFHHGQFPFFHRRREEKAKLSLPWDWVSSNKEGLKMLLLNVTFISGNPLVPLDSCSCMKQWDLVSGEPCGRGFVVRTMLRNNESYLVKLSLSVAALAADFCLHNVNGRPRHNDA